MRLRLGINFVAYSDAPSQSRQQEAVEALLASKPSWCDYYSLLLPNEPVRAPGIVRGLNRSYFSKGRSLPFIKDMLDSLLDVSGDGDKLGILNSDIIVGERFFNHIMEAWEAFDAFTCHRVDIEHYGQNWDTGYRLADKSTDILIVSRKAWLERRRKLPDYILGEPGWGYGARLWLYACNISHMDLDKGECLHLKHVGKWCKGISKGRLYNRALYRGQTCQKS